MKSCRYRNNPLTATTSHFNILQCMYCTVYKLVNLLRMTLFNKITLSCHHCLNLGLEPPADSGHGGPVKAAHQLCAFLHQKGRNTLMGFVHMWLRNAPHKMVQRIAKSGELEPLHQFWIILMWSGAQPPWHHSAFFNLPGCPKNIWGAPAAMCALHFLYFHRLCFL